MPCVELIPGPATGDDAIEAVEAWLRRLGKRPVVVGDSAGFVANRIQFAMFREAAAVVAEGVASAAAVDEVVRASFGYRLPFYGPFAIADMAGLDVYLGAYEALEAEHGLAAPALLSSHVAEGRLGTKAGGGFLAREASVAEVDAAAARRDRAYHALGRLIDELGAWDRRDRLDGPTDVTREDEVQELVAAADVRAPISVLVTAAGMNRTGATTEYSMSDWDRLMAVNVRGTFLACRAVGRRLGERGAG